MLFRDCECWLNFLVPKNIGFRGVKFTWRSVGAGGVNSLGFRGVTDDVEPPKELTPITSHSIAFC